MIISNSRKFIFVHIQKCAGTSVTEALDPLVEWNDIQVGGTQYGEKFQPLFRDRFGLRKHATACEIRNVVGDEIWNGYFTFTFVRNPFVRAVSLYTHMERVLKHKVTGSSARAQPPSPPASHSLAKAFLASGSFSQFIRHRLFRGVRGARSQSSFITDGQPGPIMVDFVGKVENLEADFCRVASRIGCGERKLARRNSSLRSRDLRDFYRDEEDVALIRDVYESDFANFGYDPVLPIDESDAGRQTRTPPGKVA